MSTELFLAKLSLIPAISDLIKSYTKKYIPAISVYEEVNNLHNIVYHESRLAYLKFIKFGLILLQDDLLSRFVTVNIFDLLLETVSSEIATQSIKVDSLEGRVCRTHGVGKCDISVCFGNLNYNGFKSVPDPEIVPQLDGHYEVQIDNKRIGFATMSDAIEYINQYLNNAVGDEFIDYDSHLEDEDVELYIETEIQDKNIQIRIQ
jgi:hypothetical protein